MIEKYLDKRVKGKICKEIFAIEECITPSFELKKYEIRGKYKKQLIISHIKKIEKLSKSKYCTLTEKQQYFINEIIKYLDQDNLDICELGVFIRGNKGIMETSMLYSIMWANINLFEWLIIIVILTISLIINQYII